MEQYGSVLLEGGTPASPYSPLCDQPTLALAGDESQSDSDDSDEDEDEELESSRLILTNVQLEEKSLAVDLSSSNLEASHKYPSQSSFSSNTSEDETDPGSKRSKTSYRYIILYYTNCHS